MSYSHDNTLLQRMGFRDPDRKIPDHDRACIELATSPGRLLSLLSISCDMARVQLEQPIQKGEGKYSSTIGFVDAFLEWKKTKPSVGCNSSWEHPNGKPWVRCDKCFDYDAGERGLLLVEVKTRIENIGDLLRQMNLYRQYTRVDRYIVWSLAPEDCRYGTLLVQQGYTLVVGPTIGSLELAKLEGAARG